MTTRGGIYFGDVRHTRHSPRVHAFRYRLFMAMADLDDPDRLFGKHPLWSARTPAPVWFRERDHLVEGARPLDEVIRDHVEKLGGRRPTGPVRLLTNLRMWGYYFNPISLYFCHDAPDEPASQIVAEVSNTPWGEKHLYLLRPDNRTDASAPEADGTHKSRYRLRKDFHVSPFMPMDLEYEFDVEQSVDRIALGIACDRAGRRVFDARLNLTRYENDRRAMTRALLVHPFMTARITLAIYLQALRLLLKRTPFHSHPALKAAAKEPVRS